MARGINKAIIVGNAGRDPEMKFTPDGMAVTTLSLATSESWKDKKTGENQERSEWHNIVMYGRLAEITAEYVKKGSKIYIEGKLRTDKWQDKATGADKYKTSIVASEMQILDSKNKDSSDKPRWAGQEDKQDDLKDDDIPF